MQSREGFTPAEKMMCLCAETLEGLKMTGTCTIFLCECIKKLGVYKPLIRVWYIMNVTKPHIMQL